MNIVNMSWKYFEKMFICPFYGNTYIYFLDIFLEYFEKNFHKTFIEHSLKCKFIMDMMFT